jgi:hypothetical protein
MKLQEFNGGVSSRLAGQLIGANQGTVYENIDNSKGVLVPVKDKLATAIEVDKFNKYFVAEDTWLSSVINTDYLEFQSVMYSTDRFSRPLKYKNGNYDNLGIVRPRYASAATNISKATTLKDITTLNKTNVGDLPASDLEYLLFNVKDGVYSQPFRFVVFASSTTATRAQEFSSGSLRSVVNTITTEVNPINRAVEFKELKGKFEDKAVLFRNYDGAWRQVAEFLTKGVTVVDSVYDISAATELNEDLITPFDGTYQYVYTFYNSDDGTESAPNTISSELAASSGFIQVTLNSVSADPQVTHKRLYRVGGNITEFTMVAELSSSTTVYTDTLKDLDIDGRLLESDNYYEAPVGLNYLAEAYAMLFGALGSSLRFTPVGKPNAWPLEYEIQFDQDITGIGTAANGLLVFTLTKAYIVTGTGPTSLSQQSLRGDQGCIAFESIKEVDAGMLIWASADGLCVSSGNNVKNITKDSLGHIELTPVSSAVHDEVYYCQNKDGSILAFDYRFQPTLKWLNLGTTFLSVAKGKLYGYSDSVLYLLYKATNNLQMNYKSPLFVEGSFTENKTYKKVYVRSEGDIIIVVLIDDEIVATFDLAGKATHQLQVPQNLQRGYSIQFKVTGTGTVNEIEYTVGPRQNG